MRGRAAAIRDSMSKRAGAIPPSLLALVANAEAAGSEEAQAHAKEAIDELDEEEEDTDEEDEEMEEDEGEEEDAPLFRMGGATANVLFDVSSDDDRDQDEDCAADDVIAAAQEQLAAS